MCRLVRIHADNYLMKISKCYRDIHVNAFIEGFGERSDGTLLLLIIGSPSDLIPTKETIQAYIQKIGWQLIDDHVFPSERSQSTLTPDLNRLVDLSTTLHLI
jgi:hypothetical protein